MKTSRFVWPISPPVAPIPKAGAGGVPGKHKPPLLLLLLLLLRHLHAAPRGRHGRRPLPPRAAARGPRMMPLSKKRPLHRKLTVNRKPRKKRRARMLAPAGGLVGVAVPGEAGHQEAFTRSAGLWLLLQRGDGRGRQTAAAAVVVLARHHRVKSARYSVANPVADPAAVVPRAGEAVREEEPPPSPPPPRRRRVGLQGSECDPPRGWR